LAETPAASWRPRSPLEQHVGAGEIEKEKEKYLKNFLKIS